MITNMNEALNLEKQCSKAQHLLDIGYNVLINTDDCDVPKDDGLCMSVSILIETVSEMLGNVLEDIDKLKPREEFAYDTEN